MATKTELSNNNYLVVILLVTLLVVGGVGLAGKILLTTGLRDTKVLLAKNAAVKQLDDNLSNAPQLAQAYQNLGPSSRLLADALPTNSDFPGLIALLENLSGVAGVNLKSVTPSLTTAATTAPGAGTTTGSATQTASSGGAPTAQKYGFSLGVDGSYDAIGKLLAGFEVSARPMRVTNVQFSGTGKALTAQIDATTYYQDKASLPFTTETVK